MKRDEILEIARKEIFEKMHEFNYINGIEVIDDVREDSDFSSDLAMDPFDLLEVLMGIEEKMDIRIPDDVFGDKPIDELTVGIFVDMLYDWVKDFGYDDWEEGLETPLVDDCDDDYKEEEEYDFS